MRSILLGFLVERYDPRDQTFHIAENQFMSLTHNDVHLILGLRNSGVIIEPDEGVTTTSVAHICNNITNEGFTILSLEDEIKSQIGVTNDFIRRVVLHILGTFLIPVSTTHVPLSYYNMVRRITTIGNINWNELTLGFLRANLNLYKEGSYVGAWPPGNLALLQVHFICNTLFFVACVSQSNAIKLICSTATGKKSV